MSTTITPATFKAGERPRIRINTPAWSTENAGLREPVLTRINSRSAYFRSRYVVGEMACNAEDVEIIRHPDGTPVLETDQWPPLTPYDTGERYEAKVWTVSRRGHEDYGKVDFDNDASETEVTVWVGRVAGEVTVHILGHSYIDHVVIDTQGEDEPTVQLAN